ncbi:MAG: aldo/keto reductase [Lachnospiraceae bacterium]|nr:aldo/keto reductase [Lachnospiraceae bacterium]
MRQITLGSTGITAPQNGFGALPIQRVDMETAKTILRRAYEGGMTFFDTARAYSDSEEKLGEALSHLRDHIYIATKSQAKDPVTLREELETSLKLLKTDHVDIYQFHCVSRCYRPGDGTGMYEEMLKFKEEGKVRHIGITAHKVGIAEEIVDSGLYETLQFPLSYISSARDVDLVRRCKEANMGFIAMKGLSGGLLTNSAACMAFMTQFDNVMPIWGIQRETELEEWLSFFDNEPTLNDDLAALIEKDRRELTGDFCRGCGYCMPCTVGIIINQGARMSQMVRRAPSAEWTNEYWQKEMSKIEDCVDCGVCHSRCPYSLDIPRLLKKNWADYQNILSGKTKV